MTTPSTQPALDRDERGATLGGSLGTATAQDEPGYGLADFLRRHRAALVEKCASPELADGLVVAVATGLATGLAASAKQAAERHSLRRLSEGTPVQQLILELARLREAVLEVWSQEHSTEMTGPASRLVNGIVDSVIASAADRYVSGRDRTLQALDRISIVAFETRRVEDLLQRLLQVIVEPAASVDTASILLLDGDELVVRAAVGLDEDVQGRRFRLKIGEGFAGRIAAARRPRLLVAEEIAAEVASPALRARRLRALYGVPLQMDAQLVGVAHIGSSTLAGFSDQSIPDAVFVSDSRGRHSRRHRHDFRRGAGGSRFLHRAREREARNADSINGRTGAAVRVRSVAGDGRSGFGGGVHAGVSDRESRS